MRTALINPPQPYLIRHHTQVPLGILYLSAVIKKHRPHVTVDVLDWSAGAPEIMPAYDVYGFTSTTLDYPSCKDVAEKLIPMGTVMIGGPHATVMFQECMTDGFRPVFIGESEGTILEFIDDYESGAIRGVYEASTPVDLDKLPRPDRDQLSWLGGQVLTREHGKSINLMAARGCPRNCAFCASESMWGRKVRWRTPEDVAAEIRECIDRYGVKVYRFSDDNMTCNHSWTRTFCHLVKPLKITWRLSARVDTITYNLAATMRDAGCEEMGLGIESFDENVLRLLRKGINPCQSIRAVQMLNRVGVGARVLLMISTPGETYEHTVDENIAALEILRDKFRYVSVKIFIPLPGTAIYSNPESFGITINDRNYEHYNFYAYQRDADGKRVRSVKSPISISGMTEGQQTENITRMLDYVEELPQNAEG